MGFRFHFLLFLGLISSLICVALITVSFKQFAWSKEKIKNVKQSVKSESQNHAELIHQKIQMVQKQVEQAQKKKVLLLKLDQKDPLPKPEQSQPPPTKQAISQKKQDPALKKTTSQKEQIPSLQKRQALQALLANSPVLDFMLSQALKINFKTALSKSVVLKAFEDSYKALYWWSFQDFPTDQEQPKEEPKNKLNKALNSKNVLNNSKAGSDSKKTSDSMATNNKQTTSDPEKQAPVLTKLFQKYQNILKQYLPETISIEESYFFKLKESEFLMLFYSRHTKQLIAVFLKESFFKDPSKHGLFTSFNSDQDIFFRNHKKMGGHKQLSPVIEGFFKQPQSLRKAKYINIHSNKKALRHTYYIQYLNKSNLILLSQQTTSFSFFDNLFLKKSFFVTCAFILLLLLAGLVGLVLSQIFLLAHSYLFLKKAFISYSETGAFPLWESKNPLLFFYTNRKMILRQESQTQESKTPKNTYQLQEIVKEEIQKFQSRFPNLNIQEDFQTDIKMFGFERFLRTIMKELLSNAIEAMGTVKQQKIAISIKEKQDSLVLSVRDYGTGIADTTKAFQIYYSTKSQLGVGLNLVQSIVKANGGSISLENVKEEGGTRVSIQLPFNCFIKNS